MPYELSFTPHHALGGGLRLGCAVVCKLGLTGRVLGVSGAFKGLARGAREPWRVAFLGGLAAAGVVAREIGAIDASASTAMVSSARAACAGLLVGVGTAMGRGCTSGHGIVGNSRLSVRSMVYTLVFMASGALSATMFDTNGALGVSSTHHVLGRGATFAEPADVALWIRVGAASVCAFAAAWMYIKSAIKTTTSGEGKKSDDDGPSRATRHAIDVAVDGAAGVVFGLGLAVSGMMSPAKVSGFLSFTKESFDPSLMFVMGGAMAVTMLGMRVSGAHSGLGKPTCSYNSFDFTTNTKIDRPLLLGGVLFGTGWGLAGVCPGPAVVAAVATPSAELVHWLVALCVGVVLHERCL